MEEKALKFQKISEIEGVAEYDQFYKDNKKFIIEYWI